MCYKGGLQKGKCPSVEMTTVTALQNVVLRKRLKKLERWQDMKTFSCSFFTLSFSARAKSDIQERRMTKKTKEERKGRFCLFSCLVEFESFQKSVRNRLFYSVLVGFYETQGRVTSLTSHISGVKTINTVLHEKLEEAPGS